MTGGDELRQAVEDAKRRPTADQLYTRLQADRATTGQAAGQCEGCGSCRADGKPPVLHQPGCPHGDDWRDDPLGYLD